MSVVVLAAAVSLTVVAVRWTGLWTASWSGYFGVCLAATFAVGSTGLAVRKTVSRMRGVWISFGFAAFGWLAGGVIRTAFEPLLGGPAAPSSLADLFYLLATLPLAVGFALACQRPRGRRAVARLTLDVWVAAAAVFGLVWATLLAPLYRQASIPPGFLALDLSAPVAGIVVVCLAVAFLTRTSPAVRPPLLVAFPSLVAVAAGDMLYATSLLRGEVLGAGPAHLCWVLGYLGMAAAPWVRYAEPAAASRAGAEEERRLPSRVVGLLPVGVAVFASIALVGVGFGTRRVWVDALLLVLGGSVLAALLARFVWLFVDNEALTDRIATTERRFRSVVRTDGGVVLVLDLDGRLSFVSAGSQRLYGYDAEELCGHRVTELIHPEDLPRARAAVGAFVRDGSAGGSVRVDCRVRAADGTWRHTQSAVSWQGAEHERLIAVARDVSDQVALREQLDHLIFHDGLTGLPNRAYFEERTREVLARRAGGDIAVLFLDLDNFTSVNDSVGHSSGDHVLAQAGRRLRSVVDAENTVARFGGDEFAVLVETHGATQGVVDLAELLVRTLSEPFRVAGRDIALTASVGVVFGWEDARTEDLLRNADVAMSRARRHGGAKVEVFAASMHADVMRRLELGTRLRQAIEDEEFAVEYQPVVDLFTSRVTGVEALVRWWRDGTLVPPEGFIPYAEESGLIVPIGEWVLREACHQAARWRESDWHIGLSVNFAPRQVAEPGFVETVAGVLADSGLSPAALTLEVTEDVLVGDREGVEGTITRLHELRELGVRLAVDDFGTGYASLAYLRQLPVDTLKIDPSFISGLGHEDVPTVLTRTVVGLGEDLGLLVIAEGIERPDQLEQLRSMSCPRGQGYLVARPMAARGVESLLRTGVSPTAGHAAPLTPAFFS